MATVTGYTAARMKEIEDAAIIDGDIVGDDLILTRFDAATINAGNVRGPQGVDGYPGDSAIQIVTSTTRPGSPFEGMVIYETDTNRNYTWNGTLWLPASGEMRAKAKLGAAQSVPNGTLTNVAFTTEMYDTDAIWAPGAPSNFVIPSNGAGLWEFIFTGKFNSTSGSFLFFLVRSISGGGSETLVSASNILSAGANVCMVVDSIVGAGDYIYCVAYQTSGGALSIDAFNVTSLSAVRLAA